MKIGSVKVSPTAFVSLLPFAVVAKYIFIGFLRGKDKLWKSYVWLFLLRITYLKLFAINIVFNIARGEGYVLPQKNKI